MNVQAYFARHAQTLIGSLGRIVHHPFATLMTMGVVAVALALPLFLNLLLTNARTATSDWNDAFDLSVYMDKQAGSARTATLAKQLRQRGDIAAVRVISADEGLAEFRSTSGFGKALDALTDNPLPDTLIITPTLTASTPEGTDTLKAAIAAMAGVQSVQLDTGWVKRLHGMLIFAAKGGHRHRRRHQHPVQRLSACRVARPAHADHIHPAAMQADATRYLNG